jgi:hypothetical protein
MLNLPAGNKSNGTTDMVQCFSAGHCLHQEVPVSQGWKWLLSVDKPYTPG